MLNATDWIYSKLSGDAALTALLSSSGVVYVYPNDFETLPVLAYYVTQQESLINFWDNVPNGNDLYVILDIYCRNDQNTTSIAQAVDTIMTSLLFTLDLCEPLGDTEAKTQHLTLRYSRNGVLESDLI